LLLIFIKTDYPKILEDIMVYEVKMPKLDMTMEQGIIIKWFKKEGEKINKGELLFEVSTEKVSTEIESEVSGTIVKINFSPDDIVKVDEVVAIIETEG
jgi:pyruvate/2-oxoglutarate dehydrogenase complex dihydrolipoamide acyltransferase (E2) component